MSFDYIIVGAGSAGCVLANRLSADPGRTVLLLEAGPEDRSPLIRIPKGFGKLLDDDTLAWHYPVRPIGPSNRVEHWVRGRTLGGSSSVNGMIYNRGSRADFDGLVALGNPGWGWDEILPIYRQMENHALGAGPSRGVGGPLDVSTATDLPQLCTDTIEAGVAAGLKQTDDVNDGDEERIGPAARTITRGTRVSSARAFLRPVLGRPNLTVRTGATVTQVIVEGDRAVGVRVTEGGTTTDERAALEVVLSLGSLATPRLLQLSGIGDAAQLRGIGIDARVDSPNVGQRMREHRTVTLQFRLKDRIGDNRLLSTPLRQTVTGLRYLATKRGPLARAAYDVVGFVRTDVQAPRPDAMLLMGPFSALPYEPGGKLGLEREPGLQCIGYVLRPGSQGSVHITSADPAAPLDIDPQFLTAASDHQGTAALFRRIRELFGLEPVASRIKAETVPGLAVQSDAEIVDAALDLGYCGYHAVGTAGMGPDPSDVVDSRLRVRGLRGLRIVDCSVLPTMVAGNLNAPIMAMAWRAADLMREDG